MLYILVQGNDHFKSSEQICDDIIMHVWISKDLPAVKLDTQHLNDVNGN